MLGFVSVHDFSRAEDAAEFDRALAPAAQSPLIVSVRSISPCGNPSRARSSCGDVLCKSEDEAIAFGKRYLAYMPQSFEGAPARRGGQTAEVQAGRRVRTSFPPTRTKPST